MGLSHLIEKLHTAWLDNRIAQLVGKCGGTASAMESAARHLDNPDLAPIIQTQMVKTRKRYLHDLHKVRLLAARREQLYGPDEWTERVKDLEGGDLPADAPDHGDAGLTPNSE
jgi:hypothetical protein